MSTNHINQTVALAEEEVWLPAAKARHMMGQGRHKFYDLVRAGEIDARKDGSRTVVSLSSIRRRMNNLPRAASKAG